MPWLRYLTTACILLGVALLAFGLFQYAVSPNATGTILSGVTLLIVGFGAWQYQQR